MTTRREEQEEDNKSSISTSFLQDRNPTVQSAANAAVSIGTTPNTVVENQRLHVRATITALNETTESIKKSIDKIRREVSLYSQAVNDYQERSFQDAKEIVDTYLETQNEIITAFQSACAPFMRTNDDGMNYLYNWVAPKWIAQTYGNTVSVIADNIIAATRLANNMTFVNMEAFKTGMKQANDNAKDLSRIAVKTARSFEHTVSERSDFNT